MNAYTTIEESKQLIEAGLDVNTADMLHEQHYNAESYVTIKPWTTKGKSIGAHILPCWSLAALLDVASTHCDRLEIALRADKKYNVFAVKDDFVFRSFDDHPDGFGNLIDACVTVIEELNKLKML